MKVRAWADWVPGKTAEVLDGHTDEVVAVVFSPDGALLATASHDKTVRLWEAASGRPVRVLEGHTGAVYGVAFSQKEPLLASVGADKTVRLWR